MQIVIEIDEEMRDWLHNGFLDEGDGKHAINAILKGTPLPKGHGNLIDVSDLTPDADYEDGIFGAVSCQQIVEAEVIVEAESEGERDENRANIKR